MKKIELIEFLRGYSILTIVMYHYLQSFHLQNIFGKLIAFGGTGIHLFVLLSGFGLYYSHIHKPLKMGDFLWKRITKIYFPYIAVVFVSALIALIIPIYKSSWYALGGNIFLYKMFDEHIIGSYGYPLWFISMIIQFYLAFNLMIYLKNKVQNINFIIINLVISIVWVGIVVLLDKEDMRIWNSFFFRYTWEFAIGIVLADRFVHNNYSLTIKIKNYQLLIIALLGCGLYASLALFCGTIGKLTNDIPALIGYSAFAVWIYKTNVQVFNRFMLYSGKISYPLYLLHTLFQQMLLYYIGGINLPLSLLSALILTYIFSNLYQKIINFVYRGF